MKKRIRLDRQEQIRIRWEQARSTLNERQARHWAAKESLAFGYGGVSVVSRATGMARSTINIGRSELRAGMIPHDLVRARRHRGLRRGVGVARSAPVGASGDSVIVDACEQPCEGSQQAEVGNAACPSEAPHPATSHHGSIPPVVTLPEATGSDGRSRLESGDEGDASCCMVPPDVDATGAETRCHKPHSTSGQLSEGCPPSGVFATTFPSEEPGDRHTQEVDTQHGVALPADVGCGERQRPETVDGSHGAGSSAPLGRGGSVVGARRRTPRSRTGKAVRESRRTEAEIERIEAFIHQVEAHGNLKAWRRGRAVLGYCRGKSVAMLSDELGVPVGTIGDWLRRYDKWGIAGLWSRRAVGAMPRLSSEQLAELRSTIAAGPQAAGFTSGMWTAAMVREWIEQRFGVRYHVQYVPRLLRRLRLSVQRPRKLLARADPEAQQQWVEEYLPTIMATVAREGGELLFEDESSYWLDGTLHATWSPMGVQPLVPTFGQRKTAHVFGTISVNDSSFLYEFAPVFSGQTFHQFLVKVVDHYAPRKVFMILDNGSCHWLDDEGKKWLGANRHRIELLRLPPYSPEHNAIEGVWKITRKMTTHNRFYHTEQERNAALVETFRRFTAEPELVSGQVARYREKLDELISRMQRNAKHQGESL